MGAFVPRYPVYVPSKGRAHRPLTARMFAKAGVPFFVVVEPSEVESYEKEWKDQLLVLPEDGRGLVYSRNWIKDHARDAGHARHWQFDDDVYRIRRMHAGYRIPVDASIALCMIEDFIDRYENVALASINSQFFTPVSRGASRQRWPPFYLNSRCYTCFIMRNDLPNRWRFRYNEDTDMTLQVLSDGWCSILFNVFLIDTPATMTAKGGQMANMYGGDGRLKMARELERVWPGVVTTYRRFGRPQHRVDWRIFDTALKQLPTDEWPLARNYGLQLEAVAEKVESPNLRKLLDEHGGEE